MLELEAENPPAVVKALYWLGVPPPEPGVNTVVNEPPVVKGSTVPTSVGVAIDGVAGGADAATQVVPLKISRISS